MWKKVEILGLNVPNDLHILKYAFIPLLYITCLASLKQPEAENVIPRYVKCFTFSINLPSIWNWTVDILPRELNVKRLV
jgi:hypothetical protein